MDEKQAYSRRRMFLLRRRRAADQCVYGSRLAAKHARAFPQCPHRNVKGDAEHVGRAYRSFVEARRQGHKSHRRIIALTEPRLNRAATKESGHRWLNPPSTASTCPVTKFDALMKLSTASAISSGVPERCAGVAAIKSCARGSSLDARITPGATEFTVICGANALASARVSMITPALEAQ